MFLRTSMQSGDGASSARPVLEREQVTLSNVQIDSWLALDKAFGLPDSEDAATTTALRTVLSRYVWRRPEELDFFAVPLGRVYLREDVQGRPLYFSFARSPGVLAIVVSREARIGVEIVAPQNADALLPRIETE